MAIELSKTRDFGEIISDSFLFIRENLKPLLKCFFIFCGFFMLATLVFSYLQQTKMFGAINGITTADPNSFDTQTGPFAALSRLFGIEYLLLLLFSFLSGTMMNVTVISYMAVYKSKGNVAATPEEVWGYIKYYFFKILGSVLLITILCFISFVCCIIPGIWLYPILSLVFPIIIIENTNFGYAFSQSFRLIKENWWTTFGAMIVVLIIIIVLMSAIVIPFNIVNMGTIFLRPTKGIHLSPILTFISSFLTELCHVFYILPLVTLTICYFSLTERTDATGLMERINQLGNDTTNTTSTPEEY